ncbi:hypothetical protein JW933_01525 [candidate division FCPU426 bacterium]|nr:hypothetical protein [candidate division FCPU426 bacterium]
MATDFSGFLQLLATLGVIWYLFRKFFKSEEKRKSQSSASTGVEAEKVAEDKYDLGKLFQWQEEADDADGEENMEVQQESAASVSGPALDDNTSLPASGAVLQPQAGPSFSKPNEDAPAASAQLSMPAYTEAAETSFSEAETQEETDAASEHAFSLSLRQNLQNAVLFKEILGQPRGLADQADEFF